MNRAIFRGAALVFAFATLAAGCNKKDAEPEAVESAPAPIEVAPVPVVQDGVFRYANEIVTSGKATVSEVTQVYKGAEEPNEAITSLDKDLEVEKKARRGDWVLVSWKATAGQASFGWAPAKAVADKPEIQPVATATAAPAQDAGPTLDAGKAIVDAGSVDAKSPDAGNADAGNAKAEPGATEDAGKAEVVEEDAGSKASGASDGGTGLIKLPVNKRIPVLKLPLKVDKQQ